MAGCTDGRLYHESAFRYLLANECRRSQRSGLAHHLLVVQRNTPEGGMMPMDAMVVTSVTKVLAACLRDTDYVGWYREGRVLGGVLTAMGEELGSSQMERLRSRIVDRLGRELGDKDTGSLLVQICSCDNRIGDQWGQEPYCAVHCQNV